MPINVVELMARIVAIEKEGLAALTPTVVCDAVPFYFHAQESFPYWVNRISSVGLEGIEGDDDTGEEYDRTTYEVTARLVIGHLTGDYKGVSDERLQTYVPHMITYFNNRELLQSAAFPAALLNVDFARVTGAVAFGVFQNTGVGASQVGAEFTITTQFLELNAQAYL